MKNSFEKDLKKKLIAEAEETPNYWGKISKKLDLEENRQVTYQRKKILSIRPRYALIAASFVIICSFMLADNFLGYPFNSIKGNDSDTAANIVNTDKVKSGENNNSLSIENKIHINKINNLSSTKIKLPDGYYTKELSYNQYISELGINKNIEIPKDMFISKDTTKIYYNPDGSIFLMNGFVYSTPSQDNKDRSVQLRFQQGQIPLTDLLYAFDTETESSFGSTNAVIGYNEKTDTFISNFIHEEIGYSLKAVGLSQDEFVQIIASIVQ